MKTCCSSLAAICYWLTVSAAAWAVLSLIGIYWRPLHAESAVTILFAMAVGCFANWQKNRTFHCAITGPLFVIAAVLLLTLETGNSKRLILSAAEGSYVCRWLFGSCRMPSADCRLPVLLVWALVLIGTGIAFLLERRLTRLSSR